MKKRELLEKAGWVFLTNFGSMLVFGRVEMRLLYNPFDDSVYATYSARELSLHPFSEYEFSKLLEQ